MQIFNTTENHLKTDTQVRLESARGIFGIIRQNTRIKDTMINIWFKACTYFPFSASVRQTAERRLEARLLWTLIKPKNCIWEFKVYKGKEHVTRVATPPTAISVSSASTVQAGLELFSRTKREVGIIDLASEHSPGGAFNTSPFAGSQEEDIAEHSLLHPALVYASEHKFKETSSKFIPKHGCLYVPNVPIIRDPSTHQLTLNKRQTLHVAVVAALDLRRADLQTKYLVNGIFNEDGKKVTKDKMRAVLRAFMENQIHHIVLGALGCGAFNNPVEDIATLWQEVLAEEEFSKFEEIVFAVYSQPGKEKDSKNYQVFKNVFPSLSTTVRGQ